MQFEYRNKQVKKMMLCNVLLSITSYHCLKFRLMTHFIENHFTSLIYVYVYIYITHIYIVSLTSSLFIYIYTHIYVHIVNLHLN